LKFLDKTSILDFMEQRNKLVEHLEQCLLNDAGKQEI